MGAAFRWVKATLCLPVIALATRRVGARRRRSVVRVAKALWARTAARRAGGLEGDPSCAAVSSWSGDVGGVATALSGVDGWA